MPVNVPDTQMMRGLSGSVVNVPAGPLQLTNAPPWLDVAEASSLIDSVLPTFFENTPPPLEPTVAVPPSTTVPVQTVVENRVHVRVNVTPAGADITFTVPSVNRVCAASPDA